MCVWSFIISSVQLNFYSCHFNFLIFFSYGGSDHIYNYLFNQYLTPLTLWVQMLLRLGVLDTTLLAHLTQRVMWAIAITWCPSSSVVRRKLFQKSSPLKVLDQWKPNLVWIITRVSSFKIMSGDAVHQPTWPLLLKIEHMVKLQVFGNNSKTVNNIKNLTRGYNDQHIKIYLPCNFEVNLITHLGVIALFSSNL